MVINHLLNGMILQATTPGHVPLPKRNEGLIDSRPYEGKPMRFSYAFNKKAGYFWGGYIRGGWLISRNQNQRLCQASVKHES